jgi:2,5-dihydroxypyridine 5,6-dioxygenase
MDLYADVLPLFVREFELCNVKEGEIVAVVTVPVTRRQYVECAAAAASLLGAVPYEISVPMLRTAIRQEPLANITRGNGGSVPALIDPSPLRPSLKAALSEADFIVDMVNETVALIPFREELQAAGKRILTVLEPPELLERMFPTQEIKQSVVAMMARFTEADELRMTNPAGSDIRFDISGVKGLGQYGFADVPGKWDHWPSGMLNVWPNDGTASGVVVLTPGDVIYPFKTMVGEEVHFVVEDGYIRSIEGGLDAKQIRDYMESWNDPEVYATAHCSIGMHPKAQWSALPFYDKAEAVGIEGRSSLGGFLFTTGTNRYVGRMVHTHFDIVMLGCSAWLDGEPVLLDGRVIEKAPVAA